MAIGPKHQITIISHPNGCISTNEEDHPIDDRIEPMSTAFVQSLAEKFGILVLKMH